MYDKISALGLKFQKLVFEMSRCIMVYTLGCIRVDLCPNNYVKTYNIVHTLRFIDQCNHIETSHWEKIMDVLCVA